MAASTTVLAITSVALGISTTYFARELAIERELAESRPSTLAAWRADVERPTGDFNVARSAGGAMDTSFPSSDPDAEALSPETSSTAALRQAPAPTDAQCAPKPRKRPSLAERRAQWEKDLADPATRASIELQEKVELRWNNPGLATALGLDADQEEKLLDLLTRQQIEVRGFAYGDPAPHLGDVSHHSQELLALLGAEKMERYRKYQMTTPEQQQIRALRARLDEASTLREEQAAKLVEGMYAERKRYLESMKQQVGVEFAYSPTYPINVFSTQKSPSERLAFAEAQVERTEEFMKRIRNVAAGVLTPQQLRRYEQVQEAQRNQVHERLRNLRERVARTQSPSQR
jgi:hypothetical protein